jgi:uncharacterized Zn-finger protein
MDELQELFNILAQLECDGPGPEWDLHPRVPLVLEIGEILKASTFN